MQVCDILDRKSTNNSCSNFGRHEKSDSRNRSVIFFMLKILNSCKAPFQPPTPPQWAPSPLGTICKYRSPTYQLVWCLGVALGCRASAIIYQNTRVYGDYQLIIAINASTRQLTVQPNATSSWQTALPVSSHSFAYLIFVTGATGIPV